MNENDKKLDTLTSSECGIGFTLSVMGGKWKPLILWFLAKEGTKRYGKIRKYIPTVTNKMLSQQLKELVNEDLIQRKDFQVIPPKVEYSITEKGETLIPILDLMCAWGFENEDSSKE